MSALRCCCSGAVAGHALDVLHVAHVTEDARKMTAVFHLDEEGEYRTVVVPAYDLDLFDVGAGVADRRGHLGEHAGLVDRLDLYLARELPIDLLLPVAGYPLLRLLAEVRQVAAGIAVDHDAATRAEVAHDVVAGYRVAAFRVAHHHAFGAGNRQACVTGLRPAVFVDAQHQARG